MKSIKYLVVLICMTLGMADVAKAQVYNSEVLFYQWGTSSVVVAQFVDGVLYTTGTYTKSSFQQKLKESPDYCEKCIASAKASGKDFCNNNRHCIFKYEYDNSLSTSERMVYQSAGTINKEHADDRSCYAFSNDLSSLIIFRIKFGKVNDGDKKYCIRITKEDLSPQAINPNELDFLNE